MCLNEKNYFPIRMSLSFDASGLNIQLIRFKSRQSFDSFYHQNLNDETPFPQSTICYYNEHNWQDGVYLESWESCVFAKSFIYYMYILFQSGDEISRARWGWGT